MLVGLLYVSRVARQVRFEDARSIAANAVERNATKDITGVLLYTPSHFVQMLEGPATPVRETYARIARDPRHSHIRSVFDGPIAERRFGEWAMKVAWLPAKLGADGLEEIGTEAALALLLSATRA